MQENNENITKIIERLSEYVEFKGISFNKIATSVGVSNSYFSKMVRNNGSLGEDIIKNILHFYDDINPEWLILGIGSMLKSKTTDQVFKNTYDPYNNFNKENPCLKCEALADRDKKIHELQTKLIECQERIINLINNQKL